MIYDQVVNVSPEAESQVQSDSMGGRSARASCKIATSQVAVGYESHLSRQTVSVEGLKEELQELRWDPESGPSIIGVAGKPPFERQFSVRK